MPSVLNAKHRTKLLARLANLDPERSPRWGGLTAPAMLAHLGDQLRMTLGEHICEPIPGVWRYFPFREAFVYSPLLWVKGQQGPPEAFATAPTTWDEDLATVHELLDRFVKDESRSEWPEHPHLGRMSRRAWGVFTYRHFHHHLRQFGG